MDTELAHLIAICREYGLPLDMARLLMFWLQQPCVSVYTYSQDTGVIVECRTYDETWKTFGEVLRQQLQILGYAENSEYMGWVLDDSLPLRGIFQLCLLESSKRQFGPPPPVNFLRNQKVGGTLTLDVNRKICEFFLEVDFSAQ